MLLISTNGSWKGRRRTTSTLNRPGAIALTKARYTITTALGLTGLCESILSSCVDPVELFVETLAGNVRKHLAHGSADKVWIACDIPIGVVDIFGDAEDQRAERRSLAS